jgi:UDP-N-acetylglucosamine/UDP-N-acetylgalactosamine diphosphorylase
MNLLSEELRHTLAKYGQEHLLFGLDALPPVTLAEYAAQLQSIRFEEIASLFAQSRSREMTSHQTFAPIPVETLDHVSHATLQLGEEALKAGRVAVLVVAGGQGSRLGFEKPKGLFPIGPITGASLFRIHAEKVLALSRKYGHNVPFLVMTSPQTHYETFAYFAAEKNFGLHANQVRFFQQATMPTLDAATGRLLLEGPGSLFLSPNGHGGTLTALADRGLLAELAADGIEHILYFQVDNPLVDLASRAFLGRHIETGSEASTKVVFKERPEEKVGVLALVNGKCGIVEYSDLPRELAEAREADGTLSYRAGNTAIHLFSVPFLKRVTSGSERLAYHIARKKVAHWDATTGETITPATENALKFELFIFDALPMAKRYLVVAVKREEEFAPLKNASGPDSAERVQAAMSDLAKRQLAKLGVSFAPEAVIEISPLCDIHENGAYYYGHSES